MPDRPKPPPGYETWLDWVLAEHARTIVSRPDWQLPEPEAPLLAACNELAELRNKLALFKATAEQEETVHEFTTT